MKRYLNFIISIFLLVVIFSSCNEDEDDLENHNPPIYILEGHLYKNCQQEPYTNLELYFFEWDGGTILDPEPEENYLGTTNTDSNGYYKFSIENCFHDNIKVKNKEGDLLFRSGCVSRDGIRDQVSQVKTQNFIQIRTDSIYTQSDTLYIGIRGNQDPFTVLPGPFADKQIIPTGWIDISSISLTKIGHIYGLEHKGQAWWGMGAEEYYNVGHYPAYQVEPFIIKDISQPACGYGDTIVVDLSMRD
jgi:hypothetical protein